MTPGMKRNTVRRLMATPFASAKPRSGPILKRIRQSAKNPITVVSPLERMELVEEQSASIMASLESEISRLHSEKRCMRKTE